MIFNTIYCAEIKKTVRRVVPVIYEVLPFELLNILDSELIQFMLQQSRRIFRVVELCVIETRKFE